MKENKITVDRVLFGTALLLGAIAVFWAGIVFSDADALALTVIAIIGGVYGLGSVELVKFQYATSTLSQAILEAREGIDNFNEWLDKLDPSLRNAVRRRVEGAHVGLPAPMLTPYLIGLLVMLGLLGTFVGMVDTLRGAVIAIEGSTELQAIRDGLAAPIKGLGFAFGTSVAGVATSAMLGLMSAISRRGRMLETRRLDSRIPTVFKVFSLVHNERETFRALQVQTRALPAVAAKLDAMADRLSRLGDTLIENQDRYHESVRSNFAGLAQSMDKTFKENLSESIRLVGKTIEPVVQETMAGISQQAQETHHRLAQATKEHIESSSRLLDTQSVKLSQKWKAVMDDQHSSNSHLIELMGTSLKSFEEKFIGMAEGLLESYDAKTTSWVKRFETSDGKRLELWARAIDDAQEKATAHLAGASEMMTNGLKDVIDKHQASFDSVSHRLFSTSSSMTDQLEKIGEQTNSRQMEIVDSLKQAVRQLAALTQETASQLQSETAKMLRSSDDLIQSRMDTEKTWLEEHHQRMGAIGASLQVDLGALREDEARRGQAAVDRLEKLESVVVSHMATLGNALEAPMSRLMQTASEAPRAAANVIEALREEASALIQRDNRLLEEHRRVIEELDALSSAMTVTATEQRQSIEQMVATSREMMDEVGRRFGEQVGEKVSNFNDVAQTIAGSAVEVASLGDAFGTAVDLFNTSNENLIENLSRIEASLDKVTSRSDDQLGYYVAQARDIIDHSILSQREIVSTLRQLHPQNDPPLEADQWNS